MGRLPGDDAIGKCTAVMCGRQSQKLLYTVYCIVYWTLVAGCSAQEDVQKRCCEPGGLKTPTCRSLFFTDAKGHVIGATLRLHTRGVHSGSERRVTGETQTPSSVEGLPHTRHAEAMVFSTPDTLIRLSVALATKIRAKVPAWPGINDGIHRKLAAESKVNAGGNAAEYRRPWPTHIAKFYTLYHAAW